MGDCSPQFRGANQEEGIGAAFVHKKKDDEVKRVKKVDKKE